ncbi:D-alanyl-D-alanine carboxypeptidase family protein [Halalkalibacillus halophilus]|uniref:D-alanyl-D-alanine carboxypeptidase family protein n=1 Tax=Halalkalibacillus halophilus TaxID=392827 RepID=UPI00047FBADA|nr:D-alanyl-D-alanine carboxypeptidase family protein [Halalkalibacillus halophilus]
MKKVLIVFLVMIFFFASYPGAIAAEETALINHSNSAVLLEAETGELLFEQEKDMRLPPASMTKLMTLLMIMEALDQGEVDLEEEVRISAYAASMGGSQIFLEENETMIVNDLLKAIAVGSANDASVALAERIAGSEEAFVEKMNEKVSELGLTDSNFQNVTGLPADNHYSSAYDMGMIAKELLKHEEITEYTSIYEDYLRKGTDEEFWLVNTNKLVKFYQGVDGLKTGYTNEAKYCLTATAKRGDLRVIAVVMGADTVQHRNSDISSLLDFSFNQFEFERLHAAGEELYKWEEMRSEAGEIILTTEDPISSVYKKGEEVNLRTEIEIDSDQSWPVSQGDRIGTIHVYNGEELMSSKDLVVRDEQKEASMYQKFKRIMSDFHAVK